MIDDLIRRIDRLERRLDGLVQPERPRWVDWTPTVDQDGAVAVTVTVGRYMILGDLAVVQCDLDVTAAGTAGNAIIIQGQPTAIQSANHGSIVLGIATVNDAGTAAYVGALISNGATEWRIRAHNTTGSVGVDPNFALANGDAIRLSAAYERA